MPVLVSQAVVRGSSLCRAKYFYYLSSTFLIPEISETLMGSFTKFFGSVRQKYLDGKLWYYLLCIKFFDTPNFLKHWRDAHEIFRHCETKNFRRKNVICPLLSINFFDTKSFLENKRVPLQSSSFRSCETKNFDKTVMPRSYAWKFSMKKIVLQWNILVQWEKNFSTENRDTSPPLIHKFFPYQKFSETQNGSLAKFFRSCEIKKIFNKNVKLPPSFAWKFSIPEFFRNTEVFSYELYRHWDKNFSTEFIDIPFLCIKFFDTRNFPIHRSVPQRNFSVLWDKKIWTKSRDTPSFA